MNSQYDWKVRFALSTIPKMQEYTFSYILGIVGADDRQTGRLIGSAIRCEFRGRRYILTACHVLTAARNDYSMWGVYVGYGRPPYHIQCPRIIEDREADLALIDISDCDHSLEEPSALPAWPHDRIDKSSQRSRDYLFLHGFPGCSSFSSALLGGVVAKSLAYGAMEKPRQSVSNLRQFEFALYFDAKDLRLPHGSPTDSIPDPSGLSGSPIWRIGGNQVPIRQWNPSWSSLVGIVTKWDQEAQTLIATDSSKLFPLFDRISGMLL